MKVRRLQNVATANALQLEAAARHLASCSGLFQPIFTQLHV